MGLSDLAYFDNMLVADRDARRRKHAFMLRVFDTAALLGVDAVCGFVGRNQERSMDQNLEDFDLDNRFHTALADVTAKMSYTFRF